MNAQIALILGQDGITNGAIYALLALSILLVFTVTRVLFIPQGEFVAFGALTMAALQAGKPVLLVWLLFAFAVAEVIADLLARRKRPGRNRGAWRMAVKLIYPLVLAAL
ncbi:ABC transporter permease subunit, partial [Achromobacter insolitus]|nr:branched-chain amino acid ABC transporter permease [Achromobacter insolitus]